MKLKWLLALAASLLALVASAIEPPKPSPGSPPAKQEPAKQEPAQAPPVAPADEKSAGDTAQPAETPAPAEEDEKLPPLPPDTVPSGPPPARFNPTEKVRADFPVSFPIDI